MIAAAMTANTIGTESSTRCRRNVCLYDVDFLASATTAISSDLPCARVRAACALHRTQRSERPSSFGAVRRSATTSLEERRDAATDRIVEARRPASPHRSRGTARHDGHWSDIAGHDRAGGHDRAASHRHAGHDHRAGADPGEVLDDHWMVDEREPGMVHVVRGAEDHDLGRDADVLPDPQP